MTDKGPLKNELFEDMPLLPLKDIVVFPNMIVPVFINEDLCISAVEKSLESSRKIFLSAFKVVDQEGEGLEASLESPFDVYDIGTVCTIMRTRKLPDGRMKVLVQGLHRAHILKLTLSQPIPIVQLKKISDLSIINTTSEMEALVRAVRENLEKVVSLGKVLSPDILMILEDVSEPGRLADLVASNLGLRVAEAQSILAINSPLDRLQRVYSCLSREIEVYQMQVRIQSNAKEEINKMQREHYLREQIRAIKTELGDNDSKEELDAMWEKLEKLHISDEGREEVARQLRRLERMHQDTSEATLTRTHVEVLLGLPWGIYSQDNLDLLHVKEVLDEDHFGLDDIKDRIIEYLAVKKLNPNTKSPIICFVGPPGVGKTSLGRSIARALGREFVRISLGGVSDEADIRGHRKTYVGAFPGRIISGLSSTGSSSPVMMLDEIDKLRANNRGDPAAALLEVLDGEQNTEFTDHYLGVKYDLSRIMFIANANTLDTIPAPLLDRLELIDVSGYSEEEKLVIANEYLIPKQLKENGLDGANVQFTKNSVATIINNYTRESGLRSLERKIGAVCRKVARQYAEAQDLGEDHTDHSLKLTPSLIERHLGAQKYDRDSYGSVPTIGMATGLAYTQFGGEVLTIEACLIPSEQPKLVLTGKLGEVMKESCQAALSYIRSNLEYFGIDKDTLLSNELHVHVPAGAVPKDGPSAGIAIATAIISACLKTAPAPRIAMTGEITIHGKVLGVGGLKEKLLAAKREGIQTVLLPFKNKAVVQEIAPQLKRKVKVRFVKEFEEVFDFLFPQQHDKATLVASNTMHSDLAS